ncbi:hypothetical protein AMECASPLE_024210, partial [Ameca splendens]
MEDVSPLLPLIQQGRFSFTLPLMCSAGPGFSRVCAAVTICFYSRRGQDRGWYGEHEEADLIGGGSGDKKRHTWIDGNLLSSNTYPCMCTHRKAVEVPIFLS